MLSFPRGTEMFQFPRFPPTALCVQAAVPLHDEWWVSPFGHLRIEAQSTAPRSFSQSLTSFIGSWRQGIHRWLFVAWKEQDFVSRSAGRRTRSLENDALSYIGRPEGRPTRCSCLLCSSQRAKKRRLLQNGREDGADGNSSHEEGPNPSTRVRLFTTTHQCTNRCVSNGSNVCRPTNEKALLRKEVIQPHLPVRLPCYDFTPVTNPTFDGSFPQGVRPPASGVADFRGVTGGVYKARERIHPGVLIQDY